MITSRNYSCAMPGIALAVTWLLVLPTEPAAQNGHCPTPAAGGSSVAADLPDLTSTAKTVEGPNGITVDFAVHPLPPTRGNPWSHWGEGVVASNGRYYTAIGDHQGVDGNSFLYEYDPSTKQLKVVGDILDAFGAHQSGSWGYGKVHGQISEDSCGQLYFNTYWGTRRGLTYSGSYAGDLLMRYDPAVGQLVSLGVPMEKMGTPSTQLWKAGSLFYGEANFPASGEASWPGGKTFWVYDIVRGEVIFRSPEMIAHGSGRDIAVDQDGRAYYYGGHGDLLRYDPSTNSQEQVASFTHAGQLRASSAPAPDGKIFMTTNKSDHAYLFDPSDASLIHLGALAGDAADIALSKSGEVAYFTPGAHGSGMDIGFPLMEIDRAGKIRTIVELGPIIEDAGGPHPAGTYSYSVDPVNPGDIYILANAGPYRSGEIFGQPMMIVVHLPEQERR